MFISLVINDTTEKFLVNKQRAAILRIGKQETRLIQQ